VDAVLFVFIVGSIRSLLTCKIRLNLLYGMYVFVCDWGRHIKN